MQIVLPIPVHGGEIIAIDNSRNYPTGSWFTGAMQGEVQAQVNIVLMADIANPKLYAVNGTLEIVDTKPLGLRVDLTFKDPETFRFESGKLEAYYHPEEFVLAGDMDLSYASERLSCD